MRFTLGQGIVDADGVSVQEALNFAGESGGLHCDSARGNCPWFVFPTPLHE